MRRLNWLLPASGLILCATLAGCDAPSSAMDDARKASGPTGFERCHALSGTQVGSATIEKAEPVARGTQPIGFLKRMFVRTFLFPGLPDLSIPADFCQVSAKVRPVPGSEIAVELWLPQQWNGKMLGTGGSGFSGGLGAGFLTLRRPMGMGYAALASDVGHESTSSAKFAHDSPQQYVDYAYQGNHVAAEFAKSLIASYYGSPVKRAYFHGCSNGGRDALMLARRFPEDYDGIIAGAPAAGWSKLMTFFAWATQAADGAPKLRDKLKLVHQAVMAKCDALDGVNDQLLENPAQCAFDPGELQCKSGEGSDDCLEVEEVGALRKLYGGPHLRDGTQMYPGLPVGGEGLRKNWEEAIGSGNDGHSLFARESFRWMVYGEPEWEVSRFDIDRDYPKARERMAPIMDSDDPDLSAFTARGGKLMLYHGWNDAMIPAGATLEYHASLRTRLGPAVDTQARLFMVPGMMHCGAGSGPTDFDLLDEMDRWIESDVAPERIVATQYEPIAVFGPAPDAKIIRTRPLCAWPKVARYNGTGSTDDAVNFRCQ